MASTTLTLPAAEASPAAAQSFGIAHGTILALDLGTTTGWALRSADGAHHQRHGVVPPEPLRRRRHALPALPRLARQRRATMPAASVSSITKKFVVTLARRRARLWRSARDADRLVRAARHRLPGRAGRHDQAVHRRQGQRRQGTR